MEKHRELFRKALETRDLRPLLETPGLAFALGGEAGAVTSALALFAKGPGAAEAPAVLKNRALTALDEDWYGAAEGAVRAWASRRLVNQATLKRFGRRWVRNLGANLEAVRDLPGVSALSGLLAPDLPAFLAAAGPSLDAAAPLLPEIRRRCLVIAVDTSLRFLLRLGVSPDFVVSVDPQYWNFRHLDRQRAPGTRLVAESAVYPPCLRAAGEGAFRGAFLCGSVFPLGRFMEDRVDPKGALSPGGSVAAAAWDFARLLAPPSIWIAGLDLAFPGLRTHFKGALFEDRCLAEAGRLCPSETWAVRALRDGQPFPAPRAGGGEGGEGGGGRVLTDKRLSLYAAWFESRFRQFPSIKNRALFAQGLAIPGLESASPDALLSLPPRRGEIDDRLGAAEEALEKGFFSEEARRGREAAFAQAKSDLLSGLGSLGRAAASAAAVAGNGLAACRLGGLVDGEEARCLSRLAAADKAISESPVKDAAGFLFPAPEDLEAALPPNAAGAERHLALSLAFYQALEESAAFTLSALGG